VDGAGSSPDGRRGSDAPAAQVPHRIVVGADGSASSRRALLWAARLAKAIDAEVVAAHAIQPPAFVAGGEELGPTLVSEDVHLAWKRWLTGTEHTLEEEWCAPLREAGVGYTSVTVEGGPSALLGLANRLDADAIVVGRRGRGGLAELLLGSFSHHIVHHSSRPVVVVPQEEE
jgi:nucleotide-binding universal stress UspA family protein